MGFAGSFTSNSTVPVVSFGWLWIMPPNAILYLPGATQIVGVSSHISPSTFARRSSGSTATSGLYRVIVSPGLRARLVGGSARP